MPGSIACAMPAASARRTWTFGRAGDPGPGGRRPKPLRRCYAAATALLRWRRCDGAAAPAPRSLLLAKAPRARDHASIVLDLAPRPRLVPAEPRRHAPRHALGAAEPLIARAEEQRQA